VKEESFSKLAAATASATRAPLGYGDDGQVGAAELHFQRHASDYLLRDACSDMDDELGSWAVIFCTSNLGPFLGPMLPRRPGAPPL
jgi:hypothetical protein